MRACAFRLAEQLNLSGFDVRSYHGEAADRVQIQQDWSSGRNTFIVATVAFGMCAHGALSGCILHGGFIRS